MVVKEEEVDPLVHTLLEANTGQHFEEKDTQAVECIPGNAKVVKLGHI